MRVAREERKRPRRRRENDFMREYCWAVGWKVVVSKWERRGGAMVLKAVKAVKIAGNIC